MSTIIARCGLVCTKCGTFLKGKCQGCGSPKPMFKGCPVKKCTVEKNISTCAVCTDHADLHKCGKINSFIARVIGLITKSDRITKLNRIREIGLEAFKAENQ